MQESESLVRLVIFAVLFITLAVVEYLYPRRRTLMSPRHRWPGNLMLMITGSLGVRLIFPATPIGVAIWAENNQIGLFNLVALPGWLKFLMAILLFDLLIYFQHVFFHRLPWLWRIHRVHHTDVHIDVTTGVRFHPVEIFMSMMLKMLAAVVLGAPPFAVLAFEILLNGTALFNHSNWNLSVRLDRWLRILVVTPDMHRVHHSVLKDETDSNFGFNIPWWDHLFGTYKDQPAGGHQNMKIGTGTFANIRDQQLPQLLLQPLHSK